MTATRSVIIAAVGAAFVACASPAAAQTPPGAAKSRVTDAYAQVPPRPRTRIRVTPYPYRTYSTTFPVPYQQEFPGPGYVRQCTSWLAPENRVSGTVITPRMRCWWEPGRSDLKSYP
jgi:hypothetical protein